MSMPITLRSPARCRSGNRSCVRCALRFRSRAWPWSRCRPCGLSGGSGIGRAQQVLEMPNAAFARRAQPAGSVVARGQTLLHRLADRDVLVLHLVAEVLVGGNARLGALVLR